MIEQNYSIDEILSAVEEIQKNKKEVRSNPSLKSSIKKDFSEVPKHTLKLIEEAEEIK